MSNHPSPPKRPGWTNPPIVGEERERLRTEFLERYENGEGLRAIALSTGRNPATVAKLVTEAGGTIRRPGTCPPANPLSERDLGLKLRRLYEEGASVADLATPEVGSKNYVRRLLVEAGTQMRPPKKQRTSRKRITGPRREALAKDCRRRYEEPLSIREVAALVGVSECLTATLIVEAGGTLRPRGRSAPPNPLPPDELAARLARRYKDGESVAKLATADVGSASYVTALLLKAGVTMRGRGSGSNWTTSQGARP